MSELGRQKLTRGTHAKNDGTHHIYSNEDEKLAKYKALIYKMLLREQ